MLLAALPRNQEINDLRAASSRLATIGITFIPSLPHVPPSPLQYGSGTTTTTRAKSYRSASGLISGLVYFGERTCAVIKG